MPRTIKFRAWATENKEMFHDVYFDDLEVWIRVGEGDPAIIGDIREKSMLQHCILMQYAGLKDKNGKEIYEGDIVTCPDFLGHWTVTWEESGWILENKDKLTTNLFSGVEVIGNLYEDAAKSNIVDKEG